MDDDDTLLPLCVGCYRTRVSSARAALARKDRRPVMCPACGERRARATQHTIAPLHKSNYIHVSNPEDLKGLNNKGGFYR